ncbi:hypothetical protein K8R43_03665 [archaeon]|nr:hypothetical protein [archaeon]
MVAVIKEGQGLAVRLPDYIIESLSLQDGDEVEFAMVDDKNVKMSKLESVASPELDVLRKLNAIKFSERTKEAVDSKLTDSEKETLKQLIEKKIVSFYDKGKYTDRGVYSISRDYYYLITKKPPKEMKCGFYVIDDSYRARELMEEFKPQIKSGDILSVRSFDKKYYFVSADVVNSTGSEIIAVLGEKDAGLEDLAKQLNVDKNLIKAVLEVLRESGDVIEKKKELYALA